MTDEQMKIDLSDNVFMGNVDVQQNIMNIGECPSCSASNVKVMKCQEKQCTSKKFCELCHTNSRFFEGRFERFDSGHGSGPLCVMCLSSTWKQYEDKKRLERERVERERPERERIESERQRERMEVERLKIERAEIKTALSKQKQRKTNLEYELKNTLEPEETKDNLAESHLRVKEKWMTDCHELDAIGRTISQSVDSINRTEDLEKKISKYILIIGLIIAFVLGATNPIPFDDITAVSSECSETGGVYEGVKYDSVERCQATEFGAQSCLIYMIIPILFVLRVLTVMNKKKMSQVRLIKPTEDEAASLGPRVLRGEKDMKTIQGRLDLVKRLEKEISELELSIAISEQKLANVEAPSLSLDLDFEI